LAAGFDTVPCAADAVWQMIWYTDFVMKMKHELFVCVLVASLSLIVAAVCHRFCPGFGMAFKPLLWPLAVLPFMVRPRFAFATAFAVPLLSCAVNGMPTFPVALLLSSASLMFAAVIVSVGRLLRRIKATAV